MFERFGGFYGDDDTLISGDMVPVGEGNLTVLVVTADGLLQSPDSGSHFMRVTAATG